MVKKFDLSDRYLCGGTAGLPRFARNDGGIEEPISRTTVTGRFVKLAHLFVALAGLLATAPVSAAEQDALWRFLHLRSDALWQIVHNFCVVDQAKIHNPAPCRYVSPQNGDPEAYAILKDRIGVRQFLLIPTHRVTGIESPDLLLPGRSGYWAQAWANRDYLETLLDNKVPWDGIGLAVNSALGRTQNQLHIHIDCVRPDVRQFLKAHERAINNSWNRLVMPPNNHAYTIRRLTIAELETGNPFQLVADQGPDVAGNMAIQTVVVLGAVFRNGREGFYLLNDHANIGTRDAAVGEELLDHSCALVGRDP